MTHYHYCSMCGKESSKKDCVREWNCERPEDILCDKHKKEYMEFISKALPLYALPISLRE